jgi:hydrogenase maturation protease
MQRKISWEYLKLFDIPVRTDVGSPSSPQENCGDDSILVLGLGNILLKDEGVGVHVAQQLQQLSLPCGVEVVDGGTAGLDVLLSAPTAEKLVVIDALKAGKQPGTIYKARLNIDKLDELERFFSRDSKISLHQVGLLDALAAAVTLNRAPKQILIIGVEPGKIDCGLELTDEVKQKIPEIIDIVLKEIENAVH